MIPIDEVGGALVITAHPDDVDFGAAGTVASLTDAGATVTYCIVTDGQAGGFDHSIPRVDMASICRAEQTEAATRSACTSSCSSGGWTARSWRPSTCATSWRG